MNLKIRNLNWLAGRPVVILHEKTAKKMNVFVNDRICLNPSKKIYAVVDIFSKIVKKNEIGLSEELSKILDMKNGSPVEVATSEMSEATDMIRRKIKGEVLSNKELEFLVSEIVHNNLTESEIAYFVSAEKIRGMSTKEIIGLTKAMVKTGAKLKWKDKKVVDKHCIGGIAGNRTTPIVVAICAAAGLTFPKTSSRAITSAAGTADVIETISEVELSLNDIKKVIRKTGGCLAWGGSLGLAPSDDKIIRVERLLSLDIEPQLISSILSKKISAGSKYILIDIPYRGGKMKTLKDAKKLGEKFKRIAREFKIRVEPIYTDGRQPIGNGMGPVLEMVDVLKVLKNDVDGPADLKEKSLMLSAALMKLAGVKNSRKRADEILASGKAYEKFVDIINAQNGSEDFDKKVSELKVGKFKKVIRAKRSGKISYISNHDLNSLCRILGTPETIGAGVYLHKHLGEVDKGEVLMTLYSESRSKIRDGMKFVKKTRVVEIK